MALIISRHFFLQIQIFRICQNLSKMSIHWSEKDFLPSYLKKNIFLVCPIWLPVFSNFFYMEPELDVGINSGVALTPLPSSI